jgi:hypothetical protein
VTAIITRGDPATTLDYLDEDDGCDPGNHRRDELCARTRLETLPPLDGEDRGGAT